MARSQNAVLVNDIHLDRRNDGGSNKNLKDVIELKPAYDRDIAGICAGYP